MPTPTRPLIPSLRSGALSGSLRPGTVTSVADAAKRTGTPLVIGTEADLTTAAGKTGRIGGTVATSSAARAADEPTVQASVERALRFYRPELSAKRRGSLAIEEQTSIIGAHSDVRTTTIAERFHPPRAKEARDHALSTRKRTMEGILALRLNLEGLAFPGFAQWEWDAAQKKQTPVYTSVNSGSGVKGPIARRTVTPETLLQALCYEPPHTDWDDATHLSDAIAILDGTVAALRVVEGRVQDYKRFIDICQDALSALQQTAQQASTALEHTSVRLAEVRHDLAVLRALLVEEQERVKQTNQRRQQTLLEHVRYLAYCRPRYVDNTQPLPVAVLTAQPPPNQPLPPLPKPAVIPDAVRGVVELIREAPLRWLRDSQSWMSDFADRDALLFLLGYAPKRATVRELSGFLSKRIGQAQSTLGNFIGRSYATQYRCVQAYRQRTSDLATQDLRTLSLRDGRSLAPDVLSLGDLIDGAHGEPQLAKKASELLRGLQDTIATLYVGFGLVDPLLRLRWTTGLSEYDQAVDLRSLATLPDWATVDATNRAQLQQLVLLLYDTVDTTQPDALLLMHDVVRMCILLASHAPVKTILDAQVEQQQAVQRDSRIHVRIQTGNPKVGMRVLITPPELGKGPAKQLQAVVEDLLEEHAVLRVLSPIDQAETITSKHRVSILTAE